MEGEGENGGEWENEMVQGNKMIWRILKNLLSNLGIRIKILLDWLEERVYPGKC